jgi:hypothetical protein
MLNLRTTPGRRILLWLILATLATLITFLAFRGYLSAELLLGFSNSMTC